MQSSASGCFDLLYKHFNYIKHMGRRWPSMPRDYISPMIRTLIKWTIFQETKGSDYLTMLTLGQKKHLYPRFMGLIHLWMSICIMQNAWFSVFLSHKPIHWLQKLINEHQFLWTFTCTHREQNFQPEFIFVNTWHQSRSPQVLAAAVDQIIPGTSNASVFWTARCCVSSETAKEWLKGGFNGFSRPHFGDPCEEWSFQWCDLGMGQYL